MFFRGDIIEQYLKQVNKNLLMWCESKEKVLNIVSMPYNTCEFFIDVLLFFINKGKNVLYITNEKEEEVKLIEIIKKRTNLKSYTYINKNSIKSKCSIKIANTNMIFSIKENFDLVIFDDINSFSNNNKKDIVHSLYSKLKLNGKIIVYSIENIFGFGREIFIPFKQNKVPILEPRVLTTRININKDIPYSLYDYINWSLKCERKIILYTYSCFISEFLYKSLLNTKKYLNTNIVLYLDKNNNNILKEFTELNKGILVTNFLEKIIVQNASTDLIIYGADRKKFEYKELVYLCGMIGRSELDFKGEIIFLANCETDEIIKAKNIIRVFNRKAWEIGLLKI